MCVRITGADIVDDGTVGGVTYGIGKFNGPGDGGGMKGACLWVGACWGVCAGGGGPVVGRFTFAFARHLNT